MRCLALLTILALGCGGGTDEETEPESFECNLGPLVGSYLVSFETLGGNCGEQTSALVQLDPNAGASECVNVTEPRVSDDRCRFETHGICPFDQFAPGASVESTSLIRQDNGDASRLSGTVTINILNADGTAYCVGTYRARYVRQ